MLLLAALAAEAALKRIQVDPVNNQYVDSDGMHVIFHGIALDTNDAWPSMTDEQMALMAQWGMNFIRLGFHWHLYETAPGMFNEKYVDNMDDLVQRFGKHGIYAMLDMHQDCWSPMYCGAHGFPEFRGVPENSTDYFKGGSKAFPIPWVKPNYTDDTEFSGPYGRVDWPTCEKLSKGPFGWATCYVTDAVGSAAQRLYDNVDGVLDAYAGVWVRIAKRFKNNTGIIGYELLNEPWLGDLIKHPQLMIPGRADKMNLESFYATLHRAIRAVDNDTIIFFEPATGGNLLDALPSGFSQGPGGPAYSSKQAMSYHIYCPLIESDMPFTPGYKFLEALALAACDVMNDYQYTVRHNDVKRLNVAGFLTEFGAEPKTGFGLEVVEFSAHMADIALHSWSFWYVNPSTDPTKPNFETSTLVRTYVRSCAGIPLRMQFHNRTSRFELDYRPDSRSDVFSRETEIYVNLPIKYPHGVDVTIRPLGAATWRLGESGFVYLKHTATAKGLHAINITITRL